MSQAHRPTWNPAMGRETKAGSQQISKLSLASHTKLKFRQTGQGSTGEVSRRDLKADLMAAERVANDKKRKAAGLPVLPVPDAGAGTLRIGGGEGSGEDEEMVKRRKVLEEAAELDRDDSDDEGGPVRNGNGNGIGTGVDKGKGKAGQDDDEDEDDDSDDSDEEDETAALMAELAKIKAERAEEKARLDAENAAKSATDRESEIATGNPLLNLQAALGQSPAPSTPGSMTSSATATFAVKRRWDDDLIFKNQATGLEGRAKKGEFVNDLLRSEFHKKFMLKFIR